MTAKECIQPLLNKMDEYFQLSLASDNQYERYMKNIKNPADIKPSVLWKFFSCTLAQIHSHIDSFIRMIERTKCFVFCYLKGEIESA